MTKGFKPNPFASVTMRRNSGKAAGEVNEVRVWSLKRGEKLNWRRIRGQDADFEEVLSLLTDAAAAERGEQVLPFDRAFRLVGWGVWLLEREQMPTIRLEVPLAASGCRVADTDVTFRVRGEFWLQEGDEVPIPQLAEAPWRALSATRPILWHRGSADELILPWWPDEQCLAAFDAVRRGDGQSEMPGCVALEKAGIITRESGENESSALAQAEECFRRNHFVALPRLLPAPHVAAIRSYWRALVESGQLGRDDGQSDRYYSHTEPLSVLLQYLFAPIVERIVGVPIRPSYTYSGAYCPNSVLAPHKDRAGCKFTISLLVDYLPDPGDQPTGWPLCVHLAGAPPLAFHQALGDGLLFCGCELEHSRPVFTMGELSTSMFLHYVDRDFSGADY